MNESKFWLLALLIGAVTLLGCCALTVQCDMHRADMEKPPWDPRPRKLEKETP